MFKFERELLNIIRGLDNPNRIKILEVIINSNKEKVTYNYLLKKTKLDNDELDKQLSILSMSALIDRYERIYNLNRDKEVPYYCLSSVGKKAINNLLDIFNVK